MKVVIQRVLNSGVTIAEKQVASIANGLLVHNSAPRFARLREGAAKEHYKKIADYMKELFLGLKNFKMDSGSVYLASQQARPGGEYTLYIRLFFQNSTSVILDLWRMEVEMHIFSMI